MKENEPDVKGAFAKLREQNKEKLQFSKRERAQIASFIDESIQKNGQVDDAKKKGKIKQVSPYVCALVKKASGNNIDLTGKFLFLDPSFIWHEYRRHSDPAKELSRNQIAISKNSMVDAIDAFNNPDIVESLFNTKNNPTQRFGFVYAKKSPNGYYVVVEAVGGNESSKVTPVEIIQISDSKFDYYINILGKTLGEMLYEKDPKKISST